MQELYNQQYMYNSFSLENVSLYKNECEITVLDLLSHLPGSK